MLVRLLEFQLPHGAGGMSAQMARSLIIKRFEQFSKEYGVEFKYFTAGYQLEVWFTKESDYTLFFLVHDVQDGWREYRLVEKEVNGDTD